jgi:hypothetical protein
MGHSSPSCALVHNGWVHSSKLKLYGYMYTYEYGTSAAFMRGEGKVAGSCTHDLEPDNGRRIHFGDVVIVMI